VAVAIVDVIAVAFPLSVAKVKGVTVADIVVAVVETAFNALKSDIVDVAVVVVVVVAMAASSDAVAESVESVWSKGRKCSNGEADTTAVTAAPSSAALSLATLSSAAPALSPFGAVTALIEAKAGTETGAETETVGEARAGTDSETPVAATSPLLFVRLVVIAGGAEPSLSMQVGKKNKNHQTTVRSPILQ
jgi:hypothetical protein